MKKITIICDACGREIQPSYFRNARLDFKIDEWGGGSAGGRHNSDERFINRGKVTDIKIDKEE